MPDETEGLLPYDAWMQDALRGVVSRAITHTVAHGLPGAHHFYISFATTHPGVVMPPRLRAQHPAEMTIVLQNQFWDLGYDDVTSVITVGLSFGGVPSTLAIPLAAVTGFADPSVNYGLRFGPAQGDDAPAPEPVPEEPAPDPTPQVVSLDAFRRKPGKT